MSSSGFRLSRRFAVVEDRNNNSLNTTNVKQSLEEMYTELEYHLNQRGNRVPNRHETELGRLVTTQRERYHREFWDDMFQKLVAYKQEHGNCNVPTRTTKLGRWVSAQRQRKGGTLQDRELLTNNQIVRLENIGFVWGKMAHSGYKWWDEMYNELEGYYLTHDTCLVKRSNGKLGYWVSDQRSKRRKGELTEIQIEMLDELNFEWELRLTKYTWDENFRQLQEFHTSNGHCNVPTTTSCLGGWVTRQRKNRRRQTLTEDQIKRLDSLSFTWNAADFDGKWDEIYLELANFYLEHGHTKVLRSSGKLGRWVHKQRSCKLRRGGSNRQLTQEQISRLDAVEFIWRPDENSETWEDMYEKLKAYKEANGNCLVPQSRGKLGSWVDIQRHRQKKQHGRQKKLTQDQVKMLDALGFTWSSELRFQELWEQKFNQLKAFVDLHGHCQVPRNPRDGDKSLTSLCRWVEKMRGIHKGTVKGRSPLTEYRIQRLRSVGCIRETKKSHTI